MGALADIFAAVRLQLDGTGFEAQATALATKSGKNAGQQMSQQFDAKLKNSVLTGVGLGAGISGFNMLSTAISKTVDFVGDVVHAGMEEEASISRLGASLKANIPNWDGNTDAIEKVLASQIKLGFSDEEQRASLGLLVAATHDVDKALEIQRTAMDLARFKRISLADATDALTKVEAGSYRILKSLGIELKVGATAQEALTAVQAVANGQALEYTKTVEGKLLVAQTKFGEKMDELGVAILPAVAEGLDLVTQGAEELGGRLDRLGKNTTKETDFLQNFVQGLLFGDDAAWSAARAQLGLEAAIVKTEGALTGSADAATAGGGAIHGMGVEAATAAAVLAATAPTINSTTRYLTGLGDVADDVTTATARMGAKIKSTWSELGSIASGAASAIFGPATRATAAATNAREIDAQKVIIGARNLTNAEAHQLDVQIINQQAHIAALKKAHASASAIASAQEKLDALRTKASLKDVTAAERQAAADRLQALQQEGLGIQIEMAGRGELSKAAYATLISTLQAQAKSGNLEVANAATVALQELARLKAGIIGVNVALEAHGAFQGVGKTYARAGGGPVSAGMPYIVNENTPRSEWFVPNVSGTILTAAQAASQGAGRGGPTYNVTVNNPEPRAAGPDIGRVLRRTAALGMTS